MHELTRILELWGELESEPQPAILATVLRTQGSSYRLPGARLLLLADGRYAGSISGGCLEEDILKKAWWLTANGPVLRRYDTTPDGEIASSGFGLGCNGIIHVLLEPVVPGAASILPVLAATRETRQPATIAHIMLPAEMIGQRLIMAGDRAVRHNLADTELAERIRAEIAAEEGPAMLRLASEVEVFLERFTPPVHLLVFGAGQDAVPLTNFAKHLGWQISVFDGRAHYVKKEKFPCADSVSVRSVGSPSPPVDEWTAAVIMSHSYSQDLDVLRTLARQPLRYLGVLGPRKRTEQLLTDADLDHSGPALALHAPMGLDIGADGPEQVALAVIAEIQSVVNRRQGGALRDRVGPIHSKDNEQSSATAWVRSIVCA